jgi:hypothetical protein
MKKNGINLFFANSISPTPGDDYFNMTDLERFNKVESSLNNIDPSWNESLNLVSARENGFVVLEFKHSLAVEERSSYLINIENQLCNNVDSSITIWIAPVGDKSSLRKLRGIEVKNI